MTMLGGIVAAICIGCGGEAPSANVQKSTESASVEAPATETQADVQETEYVPEEYALPDNLDTSDVDYPIPYGNYVPSQSGEYGNEENFWLHCWALESSPLYQKETWQGSTLQLGEDSISVNTGEPYAKSRAYENISYKKTRSFNEEELELLSIDGVIIPLDHYYADNSPCTMYDVCTEEGKVPYKVLVFQDKIWLLISHDNGFRDMEDPLWFWDDFLNMVEYVRTDPA